MVVLVSHCVGSLGALGRPRLVAYQTMGRDSHSPTLEHRLNYYGENAEIKSAYVPGSFSSLSKSLYNVASTLSIRQSHS